MQSVNTFTYLFETHVYQETSWMMFREDAMSANGFSRRRFLQCGAGGVAALAVGMNLPGWVLCDPAFAATRELSFTLGDAIKNMATDLEGARARDGNRAQCYCWTYKSNLPDLAPEVPGPVVFAFEGDTINVTLRNTLPQAHNFAIPAANVVSPTIPPGTAQRPSEVSFSFQVNFPAGTYLYYDSLNEPVNRMMGLHGAFIVMPSPANGTPYSAAEVGANPRMAQLFADLGTRSWWPGLGWGQAGTNPEGLPPTPPYRQYIWLLHQPSPVLFREVGEYCFANPGQDYDAAQFTDKFLNDPLLLRGKNKAPAQNNTPQYFTISGQSGHFSHNNPFLCPNLRVGEPCVIRVLNAGMWAHSLHLHANHFYVLQANNSFAFQRDVLPGQTDNHIWLDTYTANPMDTFDWLIPYMRPPDVPNTGGVGRADLDAPLPVLRRPVPGFGIRVRPDGRAEAVDTPPGETSWPPVQEINMAIPKGGTMAGNLGMHVQLSPLCYPMHDHSEPTQTSQGGNYNMGLISGVNFTGDRNADGRLPNGVITFPNIPAEYGPDHTVQVQDAAGPLPPFPEAD